MQSRFPSGSRERDILAYRIQCGQLYQQNAIDKAKGIICKPMPKDWHDRFAASQIEDETQREIYKGIVADKKPYFMRYIYPDLSKRYNTYIKNTNRNAMREFRLSIEELASIPYNRLTGRQREFLLYYDMKMPVGVGDCVMNRICRRFEEEFDGYMKRYSPKQSFDYRIMKSRAKYSKRAYDAIMKIYKEYNHKMRSYAAFVNTERVDEFDSMAEIGVINETFRRECAMVCPNKNMLCDIILDICYNKSATKRFAWSMCGDEIISNLLASHGNCISFPVLDANGELQYCGNRFTIKTKEIEVNLWQSY